MVRIVETSGNFTSAAQDLSGRVVLRLLHELQEQPELIGRLNAQAYQALVEALVLGGPVHEPACQAALAALSQPGLDLVAELILIEQAYTQAATCYEHAMAPTSSNEQLLRHHLHMTQQRDQAQTLRAMLLTS